LRLLSLDSEEEEEQDQEVTQDSVDLKSLGTALKLLEPLERLGLNCTLIFKLEEHHKQKLTITIKWWINHKLRLLSLDSEEEEVEEQVDTQDSVD